MKKLAIIWIAILAVFFLVNPTNVFALGEGQVCEIAKNECDTGLVCQVKDLATPSVGICVSGIIKIDKPAQGFTALGNFISNALTIAFAVAVLIVLVMLIQGAFEWITSGGDKEAVGKARNRIINALIGLAVLAVAFALANIFARFTGLDLGNLTIPTPNPTAQGF